MSLAAAAVLCLLPAGAQTPAGNAVSDFGYAVGVVERAYAGYPDKTAGREAEYAALKARLQSEISGDRDVYDAIAEYLGWFDDSHLQTPGAEAYRGPLSRFTAPRAAKTWSSTSAAIWVGATMPMNPCSNCFTTTKVRRMPWSTAYRI